MAVRANRNNIVAGGFLLGALALFLFISLLLGNAGELARKTTDYTARFPLSIGVAGLDEGSAVTVGGLRVGGVKSVEIVRPGDERATGEFAPGFIEVVFDMETDVAVYENAPIDLVVPLLGTLASLNLGTLGTPDVPDPQGDDALLARGEYLRGRLAPGIIAQLGFGPEQTEQLIDTIASVQSASAQADLMLGELRETLAEVRPDAGPSAQSLRAVLANAERFSENFVGEASWETDIDAAIARVRETADLVPGIARNADGAVADAREFIGEARGVVAENRSDIRGTIRNAESLSRRLRFTTADRVDAILDEGLLTVSGYGDLADRVNVIVDREYPQVRASIANIRLATDQGRLFIQEFRAQPWRILQQPSREELEREPVYNAARAYATAVSDLRVASESLEAVVARRRSADDSRRDDIVDAGTLNEMTQRVREAFGEYQEAEQALLDLLRDG
ncbi:MAG: hypothetical protein AAF356_05015 [Planctomycetota bacterium]